LLVVFGLSSCHQETNGQVKGEKAGKVAEAKKATVQPKVDIKVNRHYDDKGNMIGYDSTYSSFYSNVTSDTSGFNRMMDFRSAFTRPPFRFDPKHSLFNDSISFPGLNDPFFRQPRFSDELSSMMQRMDSLAISMAPRKGKY
jgi:hypothetical protein